MTDDTASSTTNEPTPGLPQLVLELRDLIVAYVRQETIVPIKNLGRYILFGLAGALLLGLGVVLLAVGVLRLLQTETGSTFHGDWSWAPYGIVFVVLLAGGAATWKARGVRRARA
ncbi:MAG TPA: hypothetical protein VLV81_06755 [Acidimicrobiia bacterium]|nr:hypothetical protein [Acidimicrobiia bacterium]